MRALKNLKAFLWIAVVLVLTIGFLSPLMYFYTASKLPPLESEFDLERILRQSIESERRSHLNGVLDAQKAAIEFKRPDYARLPPNLVAAYITERGCPTYFITPREEGAPWVKRMIWAVLGKELDGDGWCEQVFASNLANRVGAKGTLETVIAADKIHKFLKKDGLVAYDLLSVRLAPGIIGVEAGSAALMKKPLLQLNLAETAEYALAIPPYGYWEQLKSCQNSTLIRQGRDGVIQRLQLVALIPESESRTAQQEPVACLRTE